MPKRSKVPSGQHTCPMCVGPYPLEEVTMNPNGPAALAYAARSHDCPGCYDTAKALCAACLKGTADVEDPVDLARYYCIRCVSAADAPPELRAALDALRELEGCDECRWDEIDWAA